jgi:ABC-type uncharacterized transport system permease subunit
MDTFIAWITSAQVKSLINNMFEQGALFSFLGIGVLITFRFFRFPDLTAEGSYPLGGAVVAILIVKGLDPYLSTVVAVLAEATAGMVTALVHTKLKINNIISGIVIMTAIYSINLRVMAAPTRPAVSLLGLQQNCADRRTTRPARQSDLAHQYRFSSSFCWCSAFYCTAFCAPI